MGLVDESLTVARRAELEHFRGMTALSRTTTGLSFTAAGADDDEDAEAGFRPRDTRTAMDQINDAIAREDLAREELARGDCDSDEDATDDIINDDDTDPEDRNDQPDQSSNTNGNLEDFIDGVIADRVAHPSTSAADPSSASSPPPTASSSTTANGPGPRPRPRPRHDYEQPNDRSLREEQMLRRQRRREAVVVAERGQPVGRENIVTRDWDRLD